MADVVFESAFQKRSTIADLVERGITDATILSQLILNGTAISDEAVLWDFKREMPVLPAGVKLNEATRRLYDAKFAEIVKDCVALYNSYGGYLIAGVDNTTRSLVGFSGAFDAPEINKRIHAATEVSIETIFRVVSFAKGIRNPFNWDCYLFLSGRPASDRQPSRKMRPKARIVSGHIVRAISTFGSGIIAGPLKRRKILSFFSVKG